MDATTLCRTSCVSRSLYVFVHSGADLWKNLTLLAGLGDDFLFRSSWKDTCVMGGGCAVQRSAETQWNRTPHLTHALAAVLAWLVCEAGLLVHGSLHKPGVTRAQHRSLQTRPRLAPPRALPVWRGVSMWKPQRCLASTARSRWVLW